MAYTKTTWVNNSAPAINADNLNKMEDGIYYANTEVDKKAESYPVQVSLTVAGWSNSAQTVSVASVTADNTVVLSPIPSQQDAYSDAGILCTAQAAGTITFTCDTTPSSAITVNVLVVD